MRYGAYHRVSDANGRELDAETTITDKVAFEQIDAWAKSRPGVEIADRYLDWDKSGDKFERPEFERLLADLEAGVIDGVVVAQVDRLSRAEVGDALAAVKLLVGEDEKNPRPLVLLDLGIDPSTEFGEFGLTLLLALSRMQWRRYRRQWQAAQGRAIERGVWIGPAPLGYRRDKRGALVTDRNARHVRQAFALAASGDMYAAMAYLEQHVPAKQWRKSDARRVLSNRAYLGEHHHGGVGHDALVAPEIFAAAQTEPRSRRSNSDYPLSHVAACANCGSGLVGGLQSVRGKRYRRMRCSAACGGGVGSVSADKLEQHVRERVAAKLSSAHFRASLTPTGQDDAAAAVDAAKWDLEQFIEGTDGLPAAAIRTGYDKRRAAVEAAERAHRELASESARREDLPAPGQLDDPRELAVAIRAGVDGIVVAPGRGPIDRRVGVLFVGEDDFDQPARTLAA